MEGWIKLHRSLLESDVWVCEPFSRGQAWVDLLLLANHKDSFFYKRGNKIDVKRGQLGRSSVELSDRWSWSRSKVNKFLKDLEKEQQIKVVKTSVTQIVTIINYDEFQQKEQQTEQQKDSRRAAEEQQKDTYKNVNNDNNEKKLNIDASQIKKLEVDLMSEIQQNNIIQKAQYKVEERNGKWVCDYNFNPYSQLRKKFNSFQFICKRFKWKFNDVNHVKNSFFNFVVKYWEFNTDTIESKLKQEYKTKFAK